MQGVACFALGGKTKGQTFTGFMYLYLDTDFMVKRYIFEIKLESVVNIRAILLNCVSYFC